jgi:hypothetical protein
MRKIFLAGVVLLFAGAVYVRVVKAQMPDTAALPILTWTTMAPVTGPYVGTTNPIRGFPGGGIAWAISGASGTLLSNGSLNIRVRGLVLAAGSSAGTNPVGMFKGAVSCMSINGSGDPDVVNVFTDGFPADSMGNSVINAKVTLPQPCLAPIVFVTSPGGSWFAITGH